MNIDGAPASPRTTSFSYRRNISEKEREERKRNRMKQRKGKTKTDKIAFCCAAARLRGWNSLAHYPIFITIDFILDRCLFHN
jgi:hypothetical protein